MNNPDKPSSSASVGQQLASSRKEWGLSVSDVARYLNLSPSTVRALEEDAYDRLPGLIFTKGYLRSYAKLLELDYERILDCADFQPDQMNKISNTKALLRYTGRYATPKDRGSALLGILLAAAVAGLVWMVVSQVPGLSVGKIVERLSAPVSQQESSGGMPAPVEKPAR